MKPRTTTTTCTLSNVLTALTVVCWAVTAAMAAIDWAGAVTGRVFSAFAVAAGMTVITLVANVRQTTGRATHVLAVAVANAPRDSYYRGYGDCAKDALDPDDPGEPEL
ncbi:hypothetical protein ACQSSU_06490 [Micromonospora echinospora]